MIGSVICFIISAFAFLIIPISDFDGGKLQVLLAYMVGVLFWFGVSLGSIITAIIGNKLKAKGYKSSKIPGVLRFFSNTKAKVIDVSMIILIILSIILGKNLGIGHMVSAMVLSLTIFFVYLHSILNGDNYTYLSKLMRGGVENEKIK